MKHSKSQLQSRYLLVFFSGCLDLRWEKREEKKIGSNKKFSVAEVSLSLSLSSFDPSRSLFDNVFFGLSEFF